MSAVRPIASIEQVEGLQDDLDSRVELERTDLGGQVMFRPRVPTVAVHDIWPRTTQQYDILWAKGTEVYAASDTTLLKSSDCGLTWTVLGTGPSGMGLRAVFLKLATGTLLTVSNEIPYKIYRSTDDGATWTAVHTYRTDSQPLTPSSWCEDGSGHVYYGEYSATDTLEEIHVYRSTDDGVTWSVFHTFPGPASTSDDRVRHVHSVVLDPVSGRVFVTVGDGGSSGPKAGIYRTNDAQDALEPIYLNEQWPDWPSERIYPVDIAFFPDHIVWATDGGTTWSLYRLPRSEFGAASPQAEQMYTLAGAGWAAIRASSDNTTWVITTAPEVGKGLDRGCHLFAVRDEGRSVYELGVVASEGGYESLTCLGSPLNNDGAQFWFRLRLFSPTAVARAELCRSTIPLMIPRRAADAPPVFLDDELFSVGLGTGALAGTEGTENTALGYESLQANTTGSRNTAVGRGALKANTNKNDNVAVGRSALVASTSGYQNTAIGTSSLGGITDGIRNVAVGMIAGRTLADGTTLNTSSYHGVYIGQDTRASTASRANEIVIGYGAVGGGSNTVQLGNTSIVAVNTTGVITAGGYKSSDGSPGLSQDVVVRNAAGDGTTTLTFKNGLLTAVT